MSFHHLQYQDVAELDRIEISREVEAIRQQLKLRQVDVSQECGVNASMLSQWMLGRYKGNIARINGLMKKWLNRRKGLPEMDPNLEAFEEYTGSKKRKHEMSLDLEKKESLESSALKKHRRLVYNYPKIVTSKSCLIPIHLDIDLNGKRLIDSFTWNLYENEWSCGQFAYILIKDLELPEYFHQPVVDSMNEQIKKAKTIMPLHKATSTISLHPININLRLNDTILFDQFEWDLSDSQSDPEWFARSLCSELGLSGEFAVQIAFSIREQLTKYAMLYREGRGANTKRLPPVSSQSLLRCPSEVGNWEPSICYISGEDASLLEREDFKKSRAMSQSVSIPPTPSPNSNSSNYALPINSCSYSRSTASEKSFCPLEMPAIGGLWNYLLEKENYRFN